jgi:hypothetical protein
MHHLAQVVIAAVRAAYTLRQDDIDGDLLRTAAELLTLRRDALTLIDGEPETTTSTATDVALG